MVPAKSSTVSLLLRARRMRSSYAAWKPAKSSVSAFLMFGTSSVRAAVGFLLVDREAEVDVRVPHDARRAVDDAEARVHVRRLLQRAHDREPDEVREADLAAAIAGELVVQDLAVDLEQLRRQRAHRRGGGDAETRDHVLDDARRRAPQDLGGLAVERHRRGRAVGLRRGRCDGRGGADAGAGAGAGAEGGMETSGRGW